MAQPNTAVCFGGGVIARFIVQTRNREELKKKN